MIQKEVATLAQAVADVPDGATVMVGGDITPQGLVVREIVEGLDRARLQALTGVPL